MTLSCGHGIENERDPGLTGEWCAACERQETVREALEAIHPDPEWVEGMAAAAPDATLRDLVVDGGLIQAEARRVARAVKLERDQSARARSKAKKAETKFRRFEKGCGG